MGQITLSNNSSFTKNKDKCDQKHYTLEEALDLNGAGVYNVTLLLVLSVIIASMGIDMFGFSMVVKGCKCDFNLTHQQSSILSSMPFIGPILMSFVWGYLSDTWGRRKCLLLASSVSFVSAIAGSLSPNWVALAVFKLIGTSFCSCAQAATFTLLGESCSQQTRSAFMLVLMSALVACGTYYFPVGYAVLELNFDLDFGVLGRFTPWRLLILVYGILLGAGGFALLAFYESPKFLASVGKTEEALNVLRNIWVRNGLGKAELYPVKYLVVDSESFEEKKSLTLLQSIRDQTVPLLKPPLLKNILLLYFITCTIYATNSSFIMWYPLIADSIFSGLKSSTEYVTLCKLMTDHQSGQLGNITMVEPQCDNRVESNTIIFATVHIITVTVANLLISRLASRKKLVMSINFIFCTVAGMILTFIKQPVVALILYIVFTSNCLAMGLVAAYYVELFPTSHRGMVSCLSVIVARSSGLAGVNIVGAFIMRECEVTFIVSSIFIFSGLIVTFFLPSDKPPKTFQFESPQ